MVSLFEQVADVNHRLELSRQERCRGNGLPHIEVEEGICLSRTGVENVHLGDRTVIAPFVRGAPAGLQHRNSAGKLRRQGMSLRRVQRATDLLPSLSCGAWWC